MLCVCVCCLSLSVSLSLSTNTTVFHFYFSVTPHHVTSFHLWSKLNGERDTVLCFGDYGVLETLEMHLSKQFLQETTCKGDLKVVDSENVCLSVENFANTICVLPCMSSSGSFLVNVHIFVLPSRKRGLLCKVLKDQTQNRTSQRLSLLDRMYRIIHCTRSHDIVNTSCVLLNKIYLQNMSRGLGSSCSGWDFRGRTCFGSLDGVCAGRANCDHSEDESNADAKTQSKINPPFS